MSHEEEEYWSEQEREDREQADQEWGELIYALENVAELHRDF